MTKRKKEMSAETFLRRMRTLKYTVWQCRGFSGDLLRTADGRCPIEAVAEVDPGLYVTGAKILGLPMRLRNQIVDAADNATQGRLGKRQRPSILQLRQRLFRAAGMKGR
jgi:hypothetical protein